MQDERYAAPPVAGGVVYSETIVTTGMPLGETTGSPLGDDIKGPVTGVDTDPVTTGRAGEDRTTTW
jgi:hypothetical protein